MNYQNQTINLDTRYYLPRYCSDIGFKGTVVNQALLNTIFTESLEIMFTVPLNQFI